MLKIRGENEEKPCSTCFKSMDRRSLCSNIQKKMCTHVYIVTLDQSYLVPKHNKSIFFGTDSYFSYLLRYELLQTQSVEKYPYRLRAQQLNWVWREILKDKQFLMSKSKKRPLKGFKTSPKFTICTSTSKYCLCITFRSSVLFEIISSS